MKGIAKSTCRAMKHGLTNKALLAAATALAASYLTAPAALQATPIYWDNTATGWDSTANWSTASGATTPDPLAVPGINDDAIFNITTVNVAETINLNAAQSANSLTFNNTGTTLLQGGGTNRTLTLGASGLTVNNGAGAVTIGSATAGQNVAITLNASQTWTGTATAGINVANTVTGASGGPVTLTLAGSGTSNVFTTSIADGASGGVVSILKTGTGTWTLQNSLSGGFSYSGNTTINQGTFQIQVGGKQIGTSFNNTVAVLGGGTLNLSQNGTNTNTFKGLAINAGASSVTRSGTTGTGTLDFGGTTASNTSGSTNKSGITRNVGGTVNFATSGEALTAQANTNGIIGGYATVGDNWAVSAGNGTTTSGAITALGTYVNDTWATGNNTTVTVDSTQTNATTYSLRFAAASARTLTLSGVNTITSGGILVSSAVAANTTTITGDTLQGAAGADLIVIQNNTNAAGALTIASIIADNTSATALTKSGAGNLTLTGTNSYTGATYVNAGTLQIGNGASGNLASGSGAVNVSIGAVLSPNLAAGDTLANAIVNNGTISKTLGANVNTLSGNISGTGGVTENLAGSTLVLSGSNSYTGSTIITAGTVKLGSVTALGSSTIGASFGTLDFNGNSVTNAVGDKTLNGATLTNTGAAVDLTGMGTIGASAVRSFFLDGTGAMTFGQAITGFYSITKNGSNAVTFSSVLNTYSGSTTINVGTLNVTGTINTTSGITINGSTAELAYNNSTTALTPIVTFTSGKLSGTGSITAAVSATNNNDTVSPGTTSAAYSFGKLTVKDFSLKDAVSSGVNAGGKLAIDIAKSTAGGAVGAAGGTYDQLSVVSTAIAPDVTNGVLVLTLGNNVEAGDIYYILDNQTALAVAGTFGSATINGSSAAAGSTTIAGNSFATYSLGNFSLAISYNAVSGTSFYSTGAGNNDIALQVVSAPEPSSLCVISVTAIGLLSRRRRSDKSL